MSKPTTHDSCQPFLADERLFYDSLKAMDNQAFTCLYARVYTPCIRHAIRHSGSPDEACDHLHTTLEQFIRQIQDEVYAYRAEAQVTTYFIEVFRRSWLQYLRQRNRQGVSVSSTEIPDETVFRMNLVDTDSNNTPADTMPVTQAMTRLSSQCRELIELYYAHGQPISRLAEQVKLSPKSAKNQLYRCRNYLRTQYRQLIRLQL